VLHSAPDLQWNPSFLKMFKQRSYQKELLDEPDIQTGLLYQNLKELAIINTYLGGHAISLKGLKEVITDKAKTYKVIDIGCGGGDSLKAIAKWADSNRYNIDLKGVDLKQDCIDYAKSTCADFPGIDFYCDDFRNVFSIINDVAIVHASLFCHHFTEEDIVAFITFCNKNNAAFIINDLERNPVAYYAIKLLTSLFSKSPLVKNDAPVSVSRGFKKKEWYAMLQKAGIKKYTVRSCPAFRHLVIIYPNA
jgi:2-polyprenyl-3-methyl-5-hydroxy-6-metoxy-1,4-benzoquinol methylase